MRGGEAPQTAVRRAAHGGRDRRIDAGGFEPTWVVELELSRPVPDLIAPAGPGGGPYRRARLLVRLHGQPIGFVEVGLRDGVAAATTTLAAIEGALGEAIADHLRADGIESEQLTQTGIAAVDPAPCEAPGPHGDADALATVIVCTRDRPASLRRTLGSLLEGDYPHYEILVVDNDPAKPATRSLVADLGGNVRYSAEPLPGLSRARNRGVREARGEVLAFIDDDVIADRGWLRNVVLGFSARRKRRLRDRLRPGGGARHAGAGILRRQGPMGREHGATPLRPDREPGRAPALPLHPWDLRCLFRDLIRRRGARRQLRRGAWGRHSGPGWRGSRLSPARDPRRLLDRP